MVCVCTFGRSGTLVMVGRYSSNSARPLRELRLRPARPERAALPGVRDGVWAMRRRWRTIMLMTGTTLCAMIAAAFVVSAWWRPFWVTFPRGDVVGVYSGALEFRRVDGWFQMGGTWTRGVILPLIYPFAAIAVPTLLVWWFGPKPPKPGHCPCGYNLTGNVSGRCPECGEAVR